MRQIPVKPDTPEPAQTTPQGSAAPPYELDKQLVESREDALALLALANSYRQSAHRDRRSKRIVLVADAGACAISTLILAIEQRRSPTDQCQAQLPVAV
jgi:hypothetical protein